MGLRASERLAERGCEDVVDVDVGGDRWFVPVGAHPVPDQLGGVLGGGGGAGGLVGGADELGDLGLGGGTARDRADLHTLGTTDERDHGDVHAVHDAVGGHGVVGPAEVGAGRVAHHDHAVVGDAGVQALLDQALRGDLLGAHWPPSCVVLRMLTPRKSAVGQPWLTAATWPGCALPQLKAPPSTQVPGPPTASIEPQNSVVVAW